MIVQACLKDHVGRLVHPSAQGAPIERLRHAFFIGTAVLTSGLALGVVPLLLASGHVPGWREAATLAWLLLPLIAAAQVSRTGQLLEGQIVSGVAWIGLAFLGFADGGLALGTAVTLLLLVPVESLPASRPPAVLRLTVVALAGVVALLLATSLGVTGAAPGRVDALLLLLAGVRVAALAAESLGLARCAEAMQRLEAQRYRVLSDAIGDLVLHYDRAGLVLAASGASERLFGIRGQDLIGRGFFERVHVGDRPAFLHAIAQAATSRDSVTVNLRLRVYELKQAGHIHPEPTFAWVEIRTRQCNSDPEPAGTAIVVAAVRDITVRVQHEAEIERAKRDAELANASKDRFIANLSHELRTPLNAIIGFAEMLSSRELSPQDPDKRYEYAAIIAGSGQHLLAVVNSLLDLSKLDAGKFELRCEPFDTADLVRTCCDMVGLKAEQAGVRLIADADPTLEPLVGDRRACKQIVLNLLSNALKFTPRGGQVVISARPDGNAVLIAVTDTGIGMVPRDLARLGDPFFQARDANDRPFEGTGLGLSVVKGLVGLHGGTIEVESAPGEGTRMAVRLPLDGRRSTLAPTATAKIEVINRYPRVAATRPALDLQKAQKIA